MARRSRHDRVVGIVHELCDGANFYKEGDVHADHLGFSYKPIDIISPSSKVRRGELHISNPDVWAKHSSNNKIDIYEVWDGQSEPEDVRDIVFAALTPNICSLAIICFDEKTAALAKRLSIIILSAIHDELGDLLLDPRNVDVITISTKARRSDSAMHSFIMDALDFERLSGRLSKIDHMTLKIS